MAPDRLFDFLQLNKIIFVEAPSRFDILNTSSFLQPQKDIYVPLICTGLKGLFGSGQEMISFFLRGGGIQ